MSGLSDVFALCSIARAWLVHLSRVWLAQDGRPWCTEGSFLIGRPGAELEMSRIRNEENMIVGPISVFSYISDRFQSNVIVL